MCQALTNAITNGGGCEYFLPLKVPMSHLGRTKIETLHNVCFATASRSFIKMGQNPISLPRF